MRITSLTLHGFKSFGNRTTLEFLPGINCVVGPNGSGKSNIIDALRWATGGGRAREFRAEEKTELIFHGAAGKRGLGYAEVEVMLEHEGRALRVFRSLHRDGTGRLRLNGKNARFLDLEEELSGSGLGRGGLAVIGQGEISGVLMADPAKLLQYVAEAAGVARLTGRREQAEDRLAAAAAHLERLADLQREQERQLARLAAEAAAAERHGELTRRELSLRFTLARARRDSLREETANLREEEGALEERLAGSGAEIEAGRQRLAVARERADESEETYRLALAEAEARRGDLRVAEERLAAAEARQGELARQADQLEREAAELAALEPPTPPEGDPEALAAAASAAAAALDSARAAAHELEGRLEERRAHLNDLARRAARAERAAAEWSTRRAELERNRDELGARLADLGSEDPDSEAAAARLEAAEQAVKECGERLAAARAAVEAAQSDHAHAAAEAEARRRAKERSEQAFRARRGYAHGPRSALASGIPGIHGSVADLIRVDREYREAIGAALGRRTEYVVVDDAEVGQRVLAHVRKAGGFVTVLPLDLVAGRPARLSDALRRAPGVIGLALDVIRVEPRYEPLLQQLLGNTTLIAEMRDAVALARAERDRPRLVTLEGDILEGYGAMSGGRRQDQSGVLGAAAELEEAEAAAREAARVAELRLAELKGLQEELRALQQERERLGTEREEARRELARAREEAAGRARLREDLERTLARVQADLAALEAPPEEVPAADTSAAEEAVRHAEAALVAAQSQLEERRQAAAAAREAHLLLRERTAAHAAAQARYEADLQRREGLAGRRAELDAARSAAAAEVEAAASALEAARRALPGDLDAKRARFEAARREQGEAERQLATLTSRRAEHAEALERCRLALARRETALEAAEEEYGRFPPGVPALEITERAARADLASVTSELERLGPVNHRAALEHQQERERHEALVAETSEAETAAAELRAALERLDRETSERLERALERVVTSFKGYVAELFGPGAEADIEVEREAGRAVGLRIGLQPPGKQTRQLNLLSVGERSMGALAFLFSLQGEGGEALPVAVLDEVDAPLDEANIRRYARFLERLAQRGTQFLLISHQKTTFEVADALWGVSSDRGVSTVFSISREATTS